MFYETFSFAFFFWVLMLFFASCKLSTSNDATVDVNGITVILKEGVPKIALELTLEDYQQQFQSLLGTKSLVGSNNFVSLADIASLYNRIIIENTIPDLALLLDANPDAISKALIDFPDMTISELKENIPQIVEIYEMQVRYLMYKIIADNYSTSTISRGNYIGGTNSQEFWLLFWNALNAAGTKKAADTAIL